MRLLWLRLENYRRFALAELEVPDGVLGLVGRNGAGKSTLVEAIGWALFGHDASRTGKEHLPRRGAQGACRVSVCFELGGEEYEVHRELSQRGQHTCAVKVGGRVMVAPGPNSAREATQALERALRMDREAFFTSLVARQGELSALSDLTPGKRKELVLRLLRIDAIDAAMALARDERRRFQAHLEGLAGQRVEPAALEAQAAQMRGARAAEAEALEGARRALQGVEASLGAVTKARAAAEEQRQRHDALLGQAQVARAQAEGAQRALEQARRQLAELESLELEWEGLAPLAEEHARLRVAVEALEARRERHREATRLAAELAELERELAALMARRAEVAREASQASALRGQAEQARAARAAAEQALAELRALGAQSARSLDEARAQASHAAARRGELERLGPEAPCPTCERSLTEALPRLLAKLDEELGGLQARAEALHKREAHQQEKLRALQGQVQAQQAQEEALKKRAEHAWRREAEAELLGKRAAELEQRRGSRLRAIEALGSATFDEAAYVAQKQRLAGLAQAHERGLQLRARLERRPALAEEAGKHEAELARWRGEALRLDQERAALRFDPRERQALEERFLALQERRSAQAVEVERRRAAVESLDAQLARLAEELAQQRALEAKMAELRQELALLERLAGERESGLLAEFRSHLMGRVRPALAQRAGELFRACTEGRYEGLELTEDYDLQVLEAGQALPLARFSGGEGDLANLCLRIATGEVLAERSGEALGFLALDEVLGSQDAQRRDHILRALAHLRGRFRQILLITHLEEVKDALEHVVYVEDAEDGTARLVPLRSAVLAPA